MTRHRTYAKSTALERNIAQHKHLEEPDDRERRIENLTTYYQQVKDKLSLVDMTLNFNCLAVDSVIRTPMSEIKQWKSYRKAQERKAAQERDAQKILDIFC